MSNAENNAPCPFCGGQVDPTGWLRNDGVQGPECENCGATAPTLALWNCRRPAQQGQGEPVILPEPYSLAMFQMLSGFDSVTAEQFDLVWSACRTEVIRLNAHTRVHADPAEVERLRTNLEMARRERNNYLGLCRDARGEAIKLRAQLDEAQALLRDAVISGTCAFRVGDGKSVGDRIKEYLAASAEPRSLLITNCSGVRGFPGGPVDVRNLPPAPGEITIHRPVLVLGSAPGASLPDNIDNYFVVSANGSISSFADLVPDVLILNGYALVDVSGVGPETRANLRGRHVKKLIVIDNLQNRNKSVEQHIQEIGIKFDQLEVWSKEQRADVCVSASGIHYPGLGGNEIPSTGVTAICYALGLSEDVTVSGIDVDSNGHNYSEGNFMRGHLDMDRATLSAISRRVKNHEQ